jgi:hypothetical protein
MLQHHIRHDGCKIHDLLLLQVKNIFTIAVIVQTISNNASMLTINVKTVPCQQGANVAGK